MLYWVIASSAMYVKNLVPDSKQQFKTGTMQVMLNVDLLCGTKTTTSKVYLNHNYVTLILLLTIQIVRVPSTPDVHLSPSSFESKFSTLTQTTTVTGIYLSGATPQPQLKTTSLYKPNVSHIIDL